MPTYTYACTDCDEVLEVVQSFTAEPLTECPRCQGRLRKVFHPVGVVFKGSGFYRTDSRETKKKASTGPSTSASASSTSDKASSSEKSSGSATSTDSGSSPSTPTASTPTSGGPASGGKSPSGKPPSSS